MDEGEAVEAILSYALREDPNLFGSFGCVAFVAALNNDSPSVVSALLRSSTAVPLDIFGEKTYTGCFRDSCVLPITHKQCMTVYREHIQFDGNSKMITPHSLDCMLRCTKGRVEEVRAWRDVMQAGPALSPSWLLHMAVKSSMQKRPEFPEHDDFSTAAQRDTWLLQRLLTPTGTPRPALRRALEEELYLRQGAIAGNMVAAGGGALAAGKVKTGADKHLEKDTAENGVTPFVAATLAWFVRLAHQPNAHRAAYATLEQWRGRSDLAPGEVAALALFHAALAASPTGGYAYEALEVPCSCPWWLFRIDLNVEDNDCFCESAAVFAKLRMARLRRQVPLKSKVAQWLADGGAGPGVPAGAAAAAASSSAGPAVPSSVVGESLGGVKRPRSSSKGAKRQRAPEKQTPAADQGSGRGASVSGGDRAGRAARRSARSGR